MRKVKRDKNISVLFTRKSGTMKDRRLKRQGNRKHQKNNHIKEYD